MARGADARLPRIHHPGNRLLYRSPQSADMVRRHGGTAARLGSRATHAEETCRQRDVGVDYQCAPVRVVSLVAVVSINIGAALLVRELAARLRCAASSSRFAGPCRSRCISILKIALRF